MNSLSIQIVKCPDDQLAPFWEYVYQQYKDHPVWVPPLRMDQKKKYSKSNPFFKQAKVAFFLAVHNDQVVGRVAAFVNHSHLDKYNDKQGHFGCFEAQGEPIAVALLDAASQWLRENGMVTMVGPYDFSINEVSGLLIDGFDRVPAIMMPYNPPEYADWFARFGLAKVKDLLAYEIAVAAPIPDRFERLLSLAHRQFPVEIEAPTGRLDAALKDVFLIFNGAWQNNWGSIPMSQAEVDDAIAAMKPIVVLDACRFARVNNRRIGMLAAIPDINGLIRTFNGRLFPFNFITLLYRLKTLRVPRFRVCLGGVLPEYVETRASAFIFIQLVGNLLKRVKREMHVKHLEISWVLEDNHNLISVLDEIEATPTTRYRLFSKPL